MMKRFLLVGLALLAPLWAHGDWAADRDASAGYVTVTVLASAVDEAVPFFIVYGSDLPPEFHAAMDAASDTDGKTIRASTADGVTQLACVPIGVNTGTDTFALLVLGTGMSASVDVDYRIYVGNASLSMPSDGGGMGIYAVFAAYAAGYMPGVRLDDISGHGFGPLVAVNTPGTAASGLEGITAATYNGTSQHHVYVGAAAVADWNTSGLSMESLAYTTVDTAIASTFSLSDVDVSAFLASNALLAFGGTTAGDPVRFYCIGASGSNTNAISSTGFTTSTWHYLFGSRTANTGITTARIDGASAGTQNTTITSPTFDRTVIGANIGATTIHRLTGRVAVALLSSSVRSADYIATMQDNWAGALYSAGAWTALSECGSGGTGLVLFGGNSQTSTANENWNDLGASLIDDATTTDVTLDDNGVYESETITYDGADLSGVPTDATSYTVTIHIKRKAENSGGRAINDLVVRFRDGSGTLVGDNLADLAGVWPATAQTKEYPLTGYTPDGTDFTSSTGVDVQATGSNTNGATLAEILTVWIEVDYEEAPCDEGSNWFSMWD